MDVVYDVQGDKTGDRPLSDIVKDYIKEKYAKPGEVFLGVVHRLDRPVSGLVVFARTSKALTRLNKMFAEGEVHKTYWAIVRNTPRASEGVLEHWLVRNEKQNKSYAYDRERPNAKKRATSNTVPLAQIPMAPSRSFRVVWSSSTLCPNRRSPSRLPYPMTLCGRHLEMQY